jgi:hypothetical protein
VNNLAQRTPEQPAVGYWDAVEIWMSLGDFMLQPSQLWSHRNPRDNTWVLRNTSRYLPAVYDTGSVSWLGGGES